MGLLNTIKNAASSLANAVKNLVNGSSASNSSSSTKVDAVSGAAPKTTSSETANSSSKSTGGSNSSGRVNNGINQSGNYVGATPKSSGGSTGNSTPTIIPTTPTTPTTTNGGAITYPGSVGSKSTSPNSAITNLVNNSSQVKSGTSIRINSDGTASLLDSNGNVVSTNKIPTVDLSTTVKPTIAGGGGAITIDEDKAKAIAEALNAKKDKGSTDKGSTDKSAQDTNSTGGSNDNTRVNPVTQDTIGTSDIKPTIEDLTSYLLGVIPEQMPDNFQYDYDWYTKQVENALTKSEQAYQDYTNSLLAQASDNNANSLFNILRALRKNRASGITSNASTGAQAAADLQTILGLNNENIAANNELLYQALAKAYDLSSKRSEIPEQTATVMNAFYQPQSTTLAQILANYLYNGYGGQANANATRDYNSILAQANGLR